MTENLKQAALRYHSEPSAGKLKIVPTKPLADQRDLALAYSPGVAEPCLEIEANHLKAASYTARSNLVGVISNGSAVLGLGNIGALASKPVMEGKAILFKNFAGVDSFDIEVDEQDVDAFCEAVARLEPTFGGINLEDIKAPQCFEIEQRLRERMNIPVFHDDQHGTAIVSAAAVINGLHIVNKDISKVKLTVSGAGAAAMACTNLLIDCGVDPKNVLMLDSRGVIHNERENLDQYKARFAVATKARDLNDAMKGCDVFLGLSQADLLDEEMLRAMAKDPLILAMANPNPEVKPAFAREIRPDAIIATGRSDYPNQVNNVLCFPFLFRGALDVGATTINSEMEVAAVHALAELARSESSEEVAKYYENESLTFGRDYILPKPFDPRLITSISPRVAEAAINSGVATLPYDSFEDYQASLERLVYKTGDVMSPIMNAARSEQKRVVFCHGEQERVLRAIQALLDQHYVKPVLIGEASIISNKIDALGLRFEVNKEVPVINPQRDRMAQAYALVADGKADAVLTGPNLALGEQIAGIAANNPLMEGMRSLAVMELLQLDTGVYFITDTFAHSSPTAEELASITRLAADEVRRFGIEPVVALVSNGAHEDSSREKMLQVKKLLKESEPELDTSGQLIRGFGNEVVDASDGGPTSSAKQANLLIMPNLDSANITSQILRSVANGTMVGPIIIGGDKTHHAITSATTPRGIINLACLAATSV